MITKLPQYYISRFGVTKPPKPMNVTLSLTYKCNSRCKTCRIYQHESVEELNPIQWCKVFEDLGTAPYWVTLSGGEPFLKGDFDVIVNNLCRICKPAIVNIPTNGLLTRSIVEKVVMVAKRNPKTQFMINVSIDHHIPEINDSIRGVKGAYHKALFTFESLQKLGMKNVAVGIHTVISRFNVYDFTGICNALSTKNPQQYITEIAEQRVELGTTTLPITPDYEDYLKAVDVLTWRMKKTKWSGLSRVTKAFRLQYYTNVLRLLKGSKCIPCFAGYASTQITPDGHVWFCCIKGESIGNLKEQCFTDIWYGSKATELRQAIKDCCCPLANVSYTNMLLHPPTLLKVARNLI